MRLESRRAEESPSVILTPPDSMATKVFLKDTPAGQSSNTEKCMCTGAHCCLCPISGDNLKVPEAYHKFKQCS